jgi:hypothetical protein
LLPGARAFRRSCLPQIHHHSSLRRNCTCREAVDVAVRKPANCARHKIGFREDILFMTSPQSMGVFSGALVFLSVVPYAIRTYQGKIEPVPTTWSLWSLIGLAVLLTYRSSGAEANVWPAYFGFINPTLIMILSVWKRGRWRKLSISERLCFCAGVASLALWTLMRRNPNLAQYALYVALIADICAAIPTIISVWREPDRDRPLAWVIFAIGYFLGVFAIRQDTFANWIVPLYMTSVALFVAFPLALYRLRRRMPLKQWA